MLQGRLQRRLRALGLDSLEAYQEHLFDSANSGRELADFIDAVTTNKTDFMREPAHFDYLVEKALPSLDPDATQRRQIKLWCAGCSSGEEPYTLAMVLSEYAERRGNLDFSLFATDISTKVLHLAQDAVYDEARIEPVPVAWQKKYLLRSRDPAKHSVRIVSELRARVRFARLNFMDDDYGVKETFDAIFFRNVMIYFDRPTQEAVVGRLCRNLRPGGHLFTGHSESLMGLNVPLRMVASAVYQKT
jgi:chemotaxis protein methyltransferase CheR